MKNKRKLFSIFVLNILLISSCYGINEYNGLKFLNSNNSSVEESSNEDFSFGIEDHYYCDFSDVSHYDERLEHKYYIYTDLIKNDNESVTFDKTGDLNFKITFYHQLDKYFFIKHRHSNIGTLYNPLAFQYRFKNNQKYQGITFDIEDGETMYKKYFRNTIVEKFCEHEEKDYTIDVSISIQ